MGGFPQLPMPPQMRQPNIEPFRPQIPNVVGLGYGAQYPYGQTSPYPYPEPLSMIQGINNFLESFKQQKDQQKAKATQEAMAALQMRAAGYTVDDNKIASLLKKSSLGQFLDFTSPGMQMQPPVASGAIQQPMPAGQTANGPTSGGDSTLAYVTGNGLGQPGTPQGPAPNPRSMPMDQRLMDLREPGALPTPPDMSRPVGANAMMPLMMQQAVPEADRRQLQRGYRQMHKPGLWDQVKSGIFGVYPNTVPDSPGMEFIQKFRPDAAQAQIASNQQQIQLLTQYGTLSAIQAQLRGIPNDPAVSFAARIGLFKEPNKLEEVAQVFASAGSRDAWGDAGRFVLRNADIPRQQLETQLAEKLLEKKVYKTLAESVTAARNILDGKGSLPYESGAAFRNYEMTMQARKDLTDRYPLLPAPVADAYVQLTQIPGTDAIRQQLLVGQKTLEQLKLEDKGADRAEKRWEKGIDVQIEGMKLAGAIRMNTNDNVTRWFGELSRKHGAEVDTIVQQLSKKDLSTEMRNDYVKTLAEIMMSDRNATIAGSKMLGMSPETANAVAGSIVDAVNNPTWYGGERQRLQPREDMTKAAMEKANVEQEAAKRSGLWDFVGEISGGLALADVYRAVASNPEYQKWIMQNIRQIIDDYTGGPAPSKVK